MTRKQEQQKAASMRKQGYYPFSWGDWWNIGRGAKSALRQGSGYHKSSAKDDQLVWDTKPGPRGGCWVRWRRESRIKEGR